MDNWIIVAQIKEGSTWYWNETFGWTVGKHHATQMAVTEVLGAVAKLEYDPMTMAVEIDRLERV